MSKNNGKRTVVLAAGMIIAIMFWVFCITFTVSVILEQNKQAENNAATRETVIIYVEPEGNTGNKTGSDETAGADGSQKETVNMEKYYMIDSAGNYVIGTGAYINRD